MNKLQRLQKLQSLIETKKNIFQNIQNNYVKIVEVGPRDGLQNEKTILSLQDKVNLINSLSETGLSTIEATSFVSPKWVPQMADSDLLFKMIKKQNGVNYPVLVPNEKGLEKAIQVGVKEIAIFAAASETFSQKNINCSIDESFQRFEKLIQLAKVNQIKIRGYVSCVLGCPYEGNIEISSVQNVTRKLFNIGCYEVSLGDTIGVGTPDKTLNLLKSLKQEFDIQKLAVHFHDTYDNAIENVIVSLQQGIRVVDSSVGGLGGCPYAKTKAGNVCTENIVYTLHQLGFETQINLNLLKLVGNNITQILQRENMSFIE